MPNGNRSKDDGGAPERRWTDWRDLVKSRRLGDVRRKAVLRELTDYVDAQGRCRVRIKRIAAATDIREKAVRAILAGLVDQRLITRTRGRSPSGRLGTYRYRLDWQAIEALPANALVATSGHLGGTGDATSGHPGTAGPAGTRGALDQRAPGGRSELPPTNASLENASGVCAPDGEHDTHLAAPSSNSSSSERQDQGQGQGQLPATASDLSGSRQGFGRRRPHRGKASPDQLGLLEGLCADIVYLGGECRLDLEMVAQGTIAEASSLISMLIDQRDELRRDRRSQRQMPDSNRHWANGGTFDG
jgi:hypothetical protein